MVYKLLIYDSQDSLSGRTTEPVTIVLVRDGQIDYNAVGPVTNVSKVRNSESVVLTRTDYYDMIGCSVPFLARKSISSNRRRRNNHSQCTPPIIDSMKSN